jgi:putative membrane protein insertion efficiency factor
MSPAQFLIILLLRFYRKFLSPAKTAIFGPLGQCRFAPTCSGYALEAVTRHGAMVGLWLAVKRLARCHPWGGAGYDPAPLAKRSVAGRQAPLCQCEPGGRAAAAVVKDFSQDLHSHGS